MSTPMQIAVKTLSGETITLHVREPATIADIKAALRLRAPSEVLSSYTIYGAEFKVLTCYVCSSDSKTEAWIVVGALAVTFA